MAEKTLEIGIIGLGKFGLRMATTLASMGHTVIGIDMSDARVQLAEELLDTVYKADATSLSVLRSLHVQDCAMTPEALAELVSIVDKGLISAKIANDIFADLMENGAMPEAYVKERAWCRSPTALRWKRPWTRCWPTIPPKWRLSVAARPSSSAFLWARSCARPAARPTPRWSMSCWPKSWLASPGA